MQFDLHFCLYGLTECLTFMQRVMITFFLIFYSSALVRSVIKNFSLAFFFPACFTVFFFQHNRAAYDVIANCIVVELREVDLRLGR